MDPVGSAALLDDQFIEVTMSAICDVEQNPRHADHLLRAIALDIHRATREVIGVFRATTLAIHLLRAESAVDDDRNIIALIPIKRILAISEILQPILTQVAKIFDSDARRDISIQCVITRFTEFPERKVLGEFHLFINACCTHKLQN